MEKKHDKSFNLTILLKTGDLDIRKIAEKNQFLSTSEYFSLLSKFINDAPGAADALAKIASLNADDNDCRTVINIQTLLDDIGCKRLVLILGDIINAIKKNNMDFAANCTKSIMNDFNGLCSRIASAKKTESLTGLLAQDDENHAAETVPFSAQSLKETLDELDQEEAARKLRILAIDDSAVILETISSILSDEYKVYGITNPMMVEKFLSQIVPELFLLDYQMPERSGFELIPIIRSFDDHKETPIIILTSMGTIDHVSVSHSLGACDFIAKPVQDSVLREKIAKHIVRKKLF